MLWDKYGGQPLPVKKIKIMKNIFFIILKNSKKQKDKRTKI